MNEDVVQAVADQIAVQRLEPYPSPTSLALARQIVRNVRQAGWDFVRINNAGIEPVLEGSAQ